MSNEQAVIRHPGIITGVGKDVISVKVLSKSACASCEVKGSCSISEVEEKVIDVINDHKEEYREGQNVTVRMERSLGYKALFYGYLLPFLILLATLITMISSTGNEGLSALVSLLILVPYYLILYYLRGRMKKVFSFRIE